MQYRILGTLDVLDDGVALDLGGRKQRTVLAALLLEPNRAVSVDRLTDAVWGDDVPPKAEASLQAYISNLRKVLEPGRRPREAATVLRTRPNGYELTVDPDDLDATRFARLVQQAQERWHDDDLDGAKGDLDAALALWAPVLPEFGGEPFVREATAHYEGLRAVALEVAFDVKLELGEHRSAVPDMEMAVGEHPFHERLWAQLALALYRCDRQADALRALAEARQQLVENVGVEPGAELRRLEAQILEQAAELDWRPPQARAGTTVLPGARSISADTAGASTFVGRDLELASLIEAAHGSADGYGRPVVVSGEPGIGKTRLVQELIAHGRREGIVTAWARCPESAAQASFWACAQIGVQLLQQNVLDRELLEALLPSEQPTGLIDPTADRLAFDIRALKALASTSAPLILVIDDLQWADPASLRMMEFVTGELRSMPVLLVVTVRPTTNESPADLVSLLAEMARQPHALRIELDGLTPAALTDWLSRREDVPVDSGVAAFLHERTAGNPFFVRELVELLASEGQLGDPTAARDAAVPAAVHDVLRRRISQLPAATQQLLPTAAIVGRTFDVDVVARVVDQPVVDVLDALDAALSSGLVEDERSLPGRFRFSHALVAETLADEVNAARRARLHAAIVEALETLREADVDSHLAELAHHALGGALAGTAEKGFEYSSRAAADATRLLAFEDAAEHWARAVQALELARPGDRETRYQTLVALGCAHLGADRIEPARQALLKAAAVAESMDDAEGMARALAPLNLATLWPASDYQPPDPAEHACFQRAVAAYTESPTVLRADLLGAMATATGYLGPLESVDVVTDEALRVARATNDPAAIVRAAIRRYSLIWVPERLTEQRELAEEMIAVADAHDLPAELGFPGHFARILHRVATGELRPDDSEIALTRTLAERSNSPAHITQWGFFEATYALLLGRFDEATAVAARTADLYRRTRAVSAGAIESIYRTIPALERGELESAMADATPNTDSSYGTVWSELLLWALLIDGHAELAAALRATVPAVPEPAEDFLKLSHLTMAGQSRAWLGETDAARVLYERLLPFPGIMVITGSGGLPFGATDHTLAVLARALGRHEAAVGHVAGAIALEEAMSARPWLARSLALQAELLGENDPAAAARAAKGARAIADELRLVLVHRQLDAAGFPR
jgi:DNA-binding SARP family transcriptional activator